MVDKTPEEVEAEALQKDVEGFNAELIPILGKYNVGLGATAFITPDGRIGARPLLFRANEPKKEAATDTATPADSAVAAPAPATSAAPLESAEV